MKVKFTLVILSILFVLNGCAKETLKTNNISTSLTDPKQVIENYYKYRNEKNKEGIDKLVTEVNRGPNIIQGFEALEHIKITSINEEVDPTFKNGYLSNGRGSINGVKEDNVKVYRVEYDVKYKEGAVVAEESGKHTWWYYVIRKNKYSLWLIDCMGQP